MTHDRPVETWLTDMDGVLVHEGVPVPGAQDFIQALEKSGKRYLVLTNNSIYTPRDLHARHECGAVDPYERLLLARRVDVDRVGDQLLAGAGLAAQEHGRVGRRDLLDLLEHIAQWRALADDVVEVELAV